MTTGGLFGRDSGQFFMPSRNGKKRKKLSMLPDMVTYGDISQGDKSQEEYFRQKYHPTKLYPSVEQTTGYDLYGTQPIGWEPTLPYASTLGGPGFATGDAARYGKFGQTTPPRTYVDDPTGGVYQPLDPSGRKRMLGAEWSRLDKQAIPRDIHLSADGNLMEIIPRPASTKRHPPGGPLGEAYQPMTPPDAVGDPTGGMYQPNTMEQEIAAWEAAQGIPQGRGGGQGNVLGAPYPLDPDAVGARQPQPLNADLEASLQRRMQSQAFGINPDDPTGGVYQPIAYPSPVDDPTGGVYQPSYPSPVDDPTGGIYQPIPTVGDPRGGSAVTGFPSNPNVLPNISPRHQTPLYPAGMSPNEAIGGNWQDVVSAGPGAPVGYGPTGGMQPPLPALDNREESWEDVVSGRFAPSTVDGAYNRPSGLESRLEEESWEDVASRRFGPSGGISPGGGPGGGPGAGPGAGPGGGPGIGSQVDKDPDPGDGTGTGDGTDPGDGTGASGGPGTGSGTPKQQGNQLDKWSKQVDQGHGGVPRYYGELSRGQWTALKTAARTTGLTVQQEMDLFDAMTFAIDAVEKTLAKALAKTLADDKDKLAEETYERLLAVSDDAKERISKRYNDIISVSQASLRRAELRTPQVGGDLLDYLEGIGVPQNVWQTMHTGTRQSLINSFLKTRAPTETLGSEAAGILSSMFGLNLDSNALANLPVSLAGSFINAMITQGARESSRPREQLFGAPRSTFQAARQRVENPVATPSL